MFFSDEIIVFLKNHLVLVVGWCFLLFFIIFILITSWINRSFAISCYQAVFLINKRNAVVIDIRDQNSYRSGYIIDSVNVPFRRIQKDKDNIIFRSWNKSLPLIVVCDSPYGLLCKVRRCFSNLGFLEVYVLQGGIYNWKNNNFPLYIKK